VDIKHFLDGHLKLHQQFHALVVSIDIVHSRRLAGTDEQKQKTKEAIKKLVQSLIGDLPMAILSWRGDGGLLLYDVGNGFTEAVNFCSLVVGLIPIINKARNIYNFLPGDMIHFRVVCNYGLIENTGDPETLTKDAIDNMFSEKQVGVIDHVVVSHNVFIHLPSTLQPRMTALPKRGTPLDPCYALDARLSLADVEITEEGSDRLRRWMAEMVLQGVYEELLIFAYTNETLYQYLTPTFPVSKVRVLMRNWLVEEEEENAHNQSSAPKELPKTPTAILRKPWAKAHTIRAVAGRLMGSDKSVGTSNVDIRFYEGSPIFKGAILRGSNGNRAAFIGLYSWSPERKEGGSPYLDNLCSSIHIADDGCAKTAYLDAIISRFEEQWKSALIYDQMIELEDQSNASHRTNIDRVFTSDNRPYLIIYPGRETENRVLPLIASEDLFAANTIKETLKSRGKTVSIEVITNNEYPEAVHTWQDHIIVLCHRSWHPHEFADIRLDEIPYRLVVDDKGTPQILLEDIGQSVRSPIDAAPLQKRDFALIIRRSRSNGAKVFYIAGLHAIGTLGAAVFLTSPHTLSNLAHQVQRIDFAVVVDCEFSSPQREVWPSIMHGPKLLV
jgi:hypothetical protein